MPPWNPWAYLRPAEDGPTGHFSGRLYGRNGGCTRLSSGERERGRGAGLIKATADLYPGNAYLLEVLTRYAGKPEVEGVNMSQADLWVWYYTFPTVEWNLKEGPLSMEGIAFSCDGVNWVATHTYNLNAGGAQFFTSAEFELVVLGTSVGETVNESDR